VGGSDAAHRGRCLLGETRSVLRVVAVVDGLAAGCGVLESGCPQEIPFSFEDGLNMVATAM